MTINLNDFIRSIPDFPKPGILYRDITPLLGSAEAFATTIRRLADHYGGLGIDVIAAAEARGFIFAAPLALEMRVGFVPIRKPGKLPCSVISSTYDLEYGSDQLQIHVDAVKKGQRVLLVDDLLATGGTIGACCKLIEIAGGTVVGCAFVVELEGLKGRDRLGKYAPFSLLQYP